MSRTDKDRPYDVQVADLRAQGKTRREEFLVGSNGPSRPSLYVDRNLSKAFLKGDLDAIKAHRELLIDKDVTVKETEFKVPVFAISCSAAGDDHHEHDENTFYQHRFSGWGSRPPVTDLFPEYKRDTVFFSSSCCFPFRRATRTVVQFEVYQNYTPSVRVIETEDYDSRLISYTGGPSKSRAVERRRRTKTRADLHMLRRSTAIEDDWDEGTYFPDDHDGDSYWN